MIREAIQGKYILGKDTKVGDTRRKHEDRVYVGEVETRSGAAFIVGIVADGVGGADAGERGAQLAIDTTLRAIKDSQSENIPEILQRAIEVANTAVYEENQGSENEGLTTIVVAIIYKNRCFIANVGDSCAYWIQSSKQRRMLKLTRDHSYYNIYGGVDINSEDASILVNAIGKKPTVYIDIGFYLKAEAMEEDQAQKLGLNGLPIQPGDSILLCSDGLIKSDPMNTRYATDDEIVDAVSTEYEPNASAIKMVSAALGRRPDDNVSAVTIQYLTEDIIKKIKSTTNRGKLQSKLMRIGAGIFALISLAVIVILGIQLNQKPLEVKIFVSLTPLPPMTATQPIDPGKARVEMVYGNGGNVLRDQYLDVGVPIIAGDDGIRIVVGEQGGKVSIIYLFSSGAMQLTDKMMPLLQNGAIYIQPGGVTGDVFLLHFPDAKASVSGSRMIVEIQGSEVWIYCFEGVCQFFVGDEGRIIDVGNKRVYNFELGEWGETAEMAYDEKWAWNERCKGCIDVIPTPTPSTVPRIIQTNKPKNENSQVPIVILPTNVPPTNVPPTNVPPTDMPPIDVPPTDVPPTDVPPTDVPPTDVP